MLAMENNKIIVQDINFDRIDEYINISKINKGLEK
jgi:hypothetical protein